MIVGDERETQCLSSLQAEEKGARVSNSDSVLRRLCEDSDETKFSYRAGHEFRSVFRGQDVQPTGDSFVEFMLEESERHESIYIEEVLHGNSDKISETCWLLKIVAFAPALRTGRPVSASTRILTPRERLVRGVNTMRPPSTLASSGSPVRRPSLRRIGPGRTTCPLVEILVSTVRQSYINFAWMTRSASG